MRVDDGPGRLHCGMRFRHFVACGAIRQGRRDGHGRGAGKLGIAHAKIAGHMRRHALFTAVALGRQMGNGVRAQPCLAEQESEYQQEGMQGATH